MEFQEFAQLLKSIMKKKNISQYELAKKSGVSRSYISGIVGKEKDIGSKEAIQKIVTALCLEKTEERELWMTWLYARGHEDLMLYIKKIEKELKARL